MKANKLIICAIALTGISLYSLSPSQLLNENHSSRGRSPASEAFAANATQVNVINNIVVSDEKSQEQVAKLKLRLASLEKSLKTKEDLLQKNTDEIKNLKDAKDEDKAKFEDKIEGLTKLIAQQKEDIEAIKKQIAASETREAQNKKDASEALNTVTCKFESKGEKLEADIKKLLEDKEAIFGKMEKISKDNDDLRAKLDKKEENKSVDNSDLVSLMSQMTSMFTAQMQSQMQLQVQMMSMLSQMQFNSAPQYTWDWSQQGYNGPYAIHENFGMGLGGYGVGIPAQGSYGGMWGGFADYHNPYSQLPQMSRQPAQQSDFGFSFGQIPQANNMRGFDFNRSQSQTLEPAQPALPQMKRQQVPSEIETISV